MIEDKDRSLWIGASDTSYVVGNWNTATFKRWWLEKLGIHKSELSTKPMKCGNAYEHKILYAVNENMLCDRQVRFPELRLRVNYDGILDDTIYECKTHKAEKEFKVSKQYWRQAQVEMFALKTKKLYIVSYGLSEDEYANYFKVIEKDKIKLHKVEYDVEFINKTYLPRLKYLKECIDEGVMPSEEHYASGHR